MCCEKKERADLYCTYVQRALKETPHVNPDCKLIYYSPKLSPGRPPLILLSDSPILNIDDSAE